MKLKRLMKAKGFSLIELMVVVAIIGILATIAIPNFQRFSNKAKQTEGKGYLSTIYSGEKAFFAEYNNYIGCVNAVGFVPDGAMILYDAGFNMASNTAVAGSYNLTATCIPQIGTNGAAATTTVTAALGPAVVAGAAGTFQAGAISSVANTATALPGAVNIDQWTIDNNRNMLNVQVGL